jgi:hypothetical protein
MKPFCHLPALNMEVVHSYKISEEIFTRLTVSRLEKNNLQSYPHKKFKYRVLDLKYRQVTMNKVFRQKARRNKKMFLL